MAKLKFVDTYLQLKNTFNPNFHYGSLDPESTSPNLGKHLERLKGKRHGVDDYLKQAKGANVVAAVHVETAAGARDPAMETEWVQSEADRTGFPQGIVGLADLKAPDAEQTLERHLRFPNLRGIRHRSEDDFTLDPAFRRGYALLGQYRLAGEIVVGGLERATNLRDLAGRFPDTPLAIDHGGLYLNEPVPNTPEFFQEWKRSVAILAQAENIFCKISGIAYFDHDWTVSTLRPWVLTCIESFGAKRCMFGLHWPNDPLFGGCRKLVDAYAEIISGFTAEEQKDLFSQNALELYRLHV